MTGTSVPINSWLTDAKQQLKASGIMSYHLDALLLLEHVTKLSRESILSRPDTAIDAQSLQQLNQLLARRLSRVPIAYILNSKEFYGRSFYVDENVLIPRPESESFIELLKKHKLTDGSLIDVGCGSGILGITAKLEAPKLNVTQTDISKAALKVAEKNAKLLGAEVTTKKQDLFNDYYDIIFANLPYVPAEMSVEKELTHEPTVALFAEENGLRLYKDFCKKVAFFKPRCVLAECLLPQQNELQDLFLAIGYKELDKDGLVQCFVAS